MRKKTWRTVVALAFSCLLPLQADASWLSDITGVDINVPNNSITFGVPRPDRIPQMLVNLPKDVAIFLANPWAGGALAYAIRRAKESARKVCVPIPPTVVQTLSQFFPPDFFPGVCWAIVRNGFSLDSYAIHDAGMAAITLEDVVVFRDAQAAQDSTLWAHELTHVRQYQSLGVEGFAALYTVAWDYLEQQARDFDQFVARTLQAQQIQAQQSANQIPRYWVAAPGWNNKQNQISMRQFASFARESTSSTQCTSFKNTLTDSDIGPPAYAEITNMCSVSVLVTSLRFLNTQTHQYRDAPCPQDCSVGTKMTKKWPVPVWEEAVGVTTLWPMTDLCSSGKYHEPSNAISWSLTFTDNGITGSRADNACSISATRDDREWSGQLTCNNGSIFPLTMKTVNACRAITSSISWFQLEQ
jgi:Domain of unknown function (DUF4157)